MIIAINLLLNDKEEWEDQTIDTFEGDESNYWNIE